MIVLYIAAYICFSFLVAFVAMYIARKHVGESQEDALKTAVLFFLVWPLLVPVLVLVQGTIIIFIGMSKLVERLI